MRSVEGGLGLGKCNTEVLGGRWCENGEQFYRFEECWWGVDRWLCQVLRRRTDRGGSTQHLAPAISQGETQLLTHCEGSVVLAAEAPACIAKCLASFWHKPRAAGPSPPTESNPKGRKSHPTAAHGPLLTLFLCCSAKAAADVVPARTAEGADGRSGCETVTSMATGLTDRERRSKSAGRLVELGSATSRAGPQWAEAHKWNRASRT